VSAGLLSPDFAAARRGATPVRAVAKQARDAHRVATALLAPHCLQPTVRLIYGRVHRAGT